MSQTKDNKKCSVRKKKEKKEKDNKKHNNQRVAAKASRNISARGQQGGGNKKKVVPKFKCKKCNPIQSFANYQQFVEHMQTKHSKK
eukprot:61712_1